MHHPSRHRNNDPPHLVPQASFVKGMNTARGQCQIDGTPGTHAHLAHIRAPLEQIDLKAATDEADSQQGPVESSADERDFPGTHARTVVSGRCDITSALAVIRLTASELPKAQGRISCRV